MNKAKINVLIILLLICIAHIAITKNIDYNFIFIISLIGLVYIQLYPKEIIEENIKQIETLIPLYSKLEIKKKLPFTQGYAASPDFLYLIVEIINKNKPQLVLEAGSGVSTVISCYALKKYSNGKIYSLDHDKKYLDNTKKEIINHNLNDYSKIIYAPLKKYKDGNIWYDTEKINNIDNIDFFIIDGPPIKFSKNIRYLAIPLLFKKMKKGSIIILDDAKRIEEKNIVALWRKEFDCFDFRYVNNSKGAYIIEKINNY